MRGRHVISGIKLLSALLALLFIFPLGAQALEPALLETTLNTEYKGTLFVQIEPDGAVYLSNSDLRELGFSALPEEGIRIDEVSFSNLKQIPNLDYTYDPATLKLDITVAAAALDSTVIDLQKKSSQDVYRPFESSAFLNYSLDYTDGDNNFERLFLFDNEVGIRKNRTLFLTDSRYINTETDSEFIRLETRFVNENETNFRRWSFGDFTTPSHELGGALALGGIQLLKRYRIDPYFKAYPTLNYSGAVTTPSDIEVLINGHRILHESLPPGPFTLENLSSFRGAGDFEIVLRDAFGREQRILSPYYLADDLLKEDLHEYSYAIGAMREQFGSESFDYGDSLFQGLHNYGISDELTIGGFLEAGSEVSDLAASATWKVKRWGVIKGGMAASDSDAGSGFAAYARYQYLTRFSGFQIGLKYFDETFKTASTLTRTDTPEIEASLNLNFSSLDYGSLTLFGRLTTDHLLDDLQQYSMVYSRRLGDNVSMVASGIKTSGREESELYYLSISYHPRADYSISSRIESTESTDSFELEWTSDQPIGEGFSYSLSARQNETPTDSSTEVNPLVNYRGKHGTYEAEIWSESGGIDEGTRYTLKTAGAVVRLGGRTAFTRPVTDSFGVVQVGDLEGVPVYLNSQEIGQTDGQGRVYLAELNAYFNNHISIDDANIPMDRSIEAKRYIVTPNLRSGICANFPAGRFQPITGRLMADLDGQLVPLEYREFDLIIGGASHTLPTGKNGEFYFDPQDLRKRQDGIESNLSCDAMAARQESPETRQEYEALVYFNGQDREFAIQVPESDDLFIDLGAVVINRKMSDGERP